VINLGVFPLFTLILNKILVFLPCNKYSLPDWLAEVIGPKFDPWLLFCAVRETTLALENPDIVGLVQILKTTPALERGSSSKFPGSSFMFICVKFSSV
jgi:hypothetical protein